MCDGAWEAELAGILTLSGRQGGTSVKRMFKFAHVEDTHEALMQRCPEDAQLAAPRQACTGEAILAVTR